LNQYKHEIIQRNDHLEVAFYTSISASDYTLPHWHQSIEILYLIEGSLDVTIQSTLYSLQKDDFIIINSKEIHQTRNQNGNTTIVLQIPLDLFRRYMEDTDMLCFEHIASETKSKLPILLNKMRRVYEQKDNGYVFNFNSLLYALLFTLVNNYRCELGSGNAALLPENLLRLEKVINYVRLHYSKPISLAEIASLLSLNEEYFCRFFKKHMGVSFLNYLNSVRLSHVYEDLIHTNRSIGSILELHGFHNYKLFMRLFKETYGCTPTKKRETKHEC